MPRGHYLAEGVKDAIWVLRAEGVSEADIPRLAALLALIGWTTLTTPRPGGLPATDPRHAEPAGTGTARG